MTRPRLQLHLSTLLIVTVLAAGLAWLNVREHVGSAVLVFNRDTIWNTARGFPFAYQERNSTFVSDAWFDWTRLAVDAAVCLALLTVAAAVIQWLTRRMERGGP
jgi:hypothetical protein